MTSSSRARGDRFLLCSDGLFNEVDENRIAGVAPSPGDPDEACRRAGALRQRARRSGQHHGVLVEVVDDGGAAEAASASLGRWSTQLATPPQPSTGRYHSGDAVAEQHSLLPDAGEDERHAADDQARGSSTTCIMRGSWAGPGEWAVRADPVAGAGRRLRGGRVACPAEVLRRLHDGRVAILKG